MLIAGMATAVVFGATVAMVLPGEAHEFGFVSAGTDSPGTHVIEAGTNETLTYTVGNSGFVPAVSYFEPGTDGIDIRPREAAISGRPTANATITFSVPSE